MPSRTTGFDGLLEAVPDALVGVDKSGVIRFVNHQTESLFGYEPDDLVGAPLETLVPQSLREIRSAHRQASKAAPKTRPLGAELKLSGRRRDGTEFPVDLALSPMDTTEGRLVVAAVHDMTFYRKSEVVRRRLEGLAAVIELSGEAMISTVDGIITIWNAAAARLYGYSSEEIVGKSILVLSPQRRTKESRSVLSRFKSSHDVETFETVHVRKNGTLFPASITLSPIHEADGSVIGASAITRDMSDQGPAIEASMPVTPGSAAVTGQRELLTAAQRMAAIVQHSDDAITGMSLNGIVTSWNPAAEKLYGYSSDEMVGRSISLLSPKDRAGEVEAVLAKIAAGEHVESFETIRASKDGKLLPLSLTVSPIRDESGTVIGASTIGHDLTSQKEAADLAISMMESSLDPLVTISPEGKITHANEATVKATGVPRVQLIGTPFSDYFTDPRKANKIYQRVFSEGMAVDYPLTMRHRDGTLTDVLYNASVYRTASGTVLGVFAAARDVTKQMQAQREIAKQQARELDRIAELERFQRLLVGRELKMIELKKEIEHLRTFAPAEEGEHSDQH